MRIIEHKVNFDLFKKTFKNFKFKMNINEVLMSYINN